MTSIFSRLNKSTANRAVTAMQHVRPSIPPSPFVSRRSINPRQFPDPPSNQADAIQISRISRCPPFPLADFIRSRKVT